MNRFANYLESKKLADISLKEAARCEEKKDLIRAFRYQNAAVGYMLTAMNNIASLYFERRKKR